MIHSASIRIFQTEILVCHPALERIRSPSPGCHPPGSSPLILVSMVVPREAQSPRGIGLDSSPGHVIFDMKIVQHHAQGVTPCVVGFNNFALILSANDHQKICAAHSDDTDPVNREPLLYACSASSGLPPTQLRSSITSDSQRCAADRSHVTKKRSCQEG